MPEGNPLAIFAPGLNALGVRWMAVGSIASSAYGERHSTLDLDVVAVVGRYDAARFLVVFPETEFYCPPAEIIEAESARPERGHFNFIINIRFIKPTFILRPEVRLNAGLFKIVAR